MLARVLGRPLRLEPVDDAGARRDVATTFPPRFVDAMLRFFADGELDDARVVPTVHQLTGRPPRTFAAWAADHAHAFAWERR